MKSSTKYWTNALLILTVFSLFLTAVFIYTIPSGSENFDWGIYLFAGFWGLLIIPLSHLLVTPDSIISDKAANILRVSSLIGAIVGLAYLLSFITNKNSLFLGTILCITTAANHRIRNLSYFKNFGFNDRLFYYTLFCSFLFASKLCWWQELDISLRSLVILIAIGSCLTYYEIESTVQSRFQITVSKILTICGIGLLVWMSVRNDALSYFDAFHHLGVFFGPVQGVRDGGALLWDIPSQYGFLSILIPAKFLQFLTPEDSIYLLNSFLLICVSLGMFLTINGVLSSNRKLPTCSVISSLLLVICSFFLFSRVIESGFAPGVSPSVGPMRFFWCYVLLYIVYLVNQRIQDNKNLYIHLILGNVLWLVAVFWSCESFIYSSFVWVPFYYWYVLRTQSLSAHRYIAQPKYMLYLKLTVPLLLAAAGAALTLILYYLKLGHGPDSLSFFEYCINFSGGFGSIPIDFGGSIWVSFFLYCFIIALLVRVKIGGWRNPPFGLLLSLAGLLWSTTSYFIARSHENNICNLLPFIVLALVLTKNSFKSAHPKDVLHSMFRGFFTSTAAVIMLVPISIDDVVSRINYPLSNFSLSFNQFSPKLDEEASSLIREAAITDPRLVYIFNHDRTILPLISHSYTQKLALSWLPNPSAIVGPLSYQRLEKYFDRYLIRKPLTHGWVLIEKPLDDLNARILKYINEHFAKGKVLDSPRWELVEYKSTSQQ